jgi:osmotically inducible protein OsmC
MVESRADATWERDLAGGRGTVRPASGAFSELPLSWAKRAEDRTGGTSPEELLAAAHAACYSMALSNGLAKQGHAPTRIETSALVGFQAGKGITGIRLSVRGIVPGIQADAFRAAAEDARENCPVSKALAGVDISVDAQLSD